ncbi:MAG: glycosyltransferase family 2 protein [Spirochaetota bacterium]
MEISVLISAFNCAPYLREAIQSILDQSFEKFELIFIDDCSVDATLEIARSFGDGRIKVLHNERNLGIIESLNRGLAQCQGDYVARMDGDDVAWPERFAKQLDFLEQHRDHACVGSWYRVLGTERVVDMPVSDEDARIRLLSASPIANPTAMVRRDVFNTLRYDSAYPYAEDYKFWAEVALKGKIANLPIPLLDYRSHPGQVTNLFNATQQSTARKIRLEQLQRIGIEASGLQAERHLQFIGGPEGFGFEETLDWAVELISANKRSGYLPEPQFSAYVLRRLASISGQERYEGLATIALGRFKKRIRALRGRHSA